MPFSTICVAGVVLGMVFGIGGIDGRGCQDRSDTGPPRKRWPLPASVLPPNPTHPLQPGSEPPVGPPPSVPKLRAGQEIMIPTGTVHTGSQPGTPGRQPLTEADMVPVTVPSFRIDTLPYPNDPRMPARTAIGANDATKLCESAGKRLCDELEWERACKGESRSTYPTGSQLDVEACGLDPRACSSPLAVLHLGIMVEEWTATPGARGLPNEEQVVRGGTATGDLEAHRCGSRKSHPVTTRHEQLGFRCCRGAAPSVTYPTEVWSGRHFDLERIEITTQRQILAALPETARYADDFRSFSADDMNQALAQGEVSRDALGDWKPIDHHVLKWFPTEGEEAWILAGQSQGSGLLVVVHPLPDGTFSHGASFILEHDPAPIAVAFAYGTPLEILWSTGWNRSGEGGLIAYRPTEGRIVIVQR